MEKFASMESLAQGAVAEKFNQELEKVFQNCMDPNTDFKKPRKIILTCVFRTNEDRDETDVSFEVKSALAPSAPVSSRFIIGKDAAGKVKASEYAKGVIPGQDQIDSETGEIIPGVVDFRTAKTR